MTGVKRGRGNRGPLDKSRSVAQPARARLTWINFALFRTTYRDMHRRHRRRTIVKIDAEWRSAAGQASRGDRPDLAAAWFVRWLAGHAGHR
ncbi:hypothetical protein [Burkholderia ubonensis]|uniref:hypothetical protein n=1 Tax=Burkholderia ubonensis TaxID=101571 RepID=UPI0012FA6027|nr:hypothetical protein [Burkholderia ubonensis]